MAAEKRNVIRNTTIELILGEIKDNFAKKTELPTKVSELTNDSGYQTATEVESAINAKIAAVYKPAGSCAFADLPSLVEANLGKVYNITDDFVTTADFLEGAGKKYKAGADVGIVGVDNEGTTVYKYNVFANFVELDGYIQKIASPVAGNIAKQKADGSLEDAGIAAADLQVKTVPAAAGNIATLGADGKLADGGKTVAQLAEKAANATAGHVASLDSQGNPTDSGIVAADLQTKTVPAAAGNLAGLNATGVLTDSGIAAGKVITEDDIKDYTKAEIDTLLGISE